MLLLSVASTAGAAGLGKLVVLSAMGEPFRAEIDLLGVTQDAEERAVPTPRLASPGMYSFADFRYNPALAGARLDIRTHSNGRRVIEIISARPLNEPFVHLLVELESNAARIVRGYTALLDPPGYRAPGAAAVEYLPAVIPATAAVTPAVARAPAADHARAAARPAPRQERLSDADAKTLAAMLERVAALETAVAQLQRQWEKPAVVTAAQPAAQPAPQPVVTKAAPAVAPSPPAAAVTQDRPAAFESAPHRASSRDSLLNNALLVLAIGLLIILAWLAWVVWGPPSREAKSQGAG